MKRSFHAILATVGLCSLGAASHAGVITSGGVFTDNATSGIGTLAGRTGPGVNLNGSTVVVNGVTFQAGTNTGNPSGTLTNGVGFAFTGVPNAFGTYNVSSVSGSVAGLANSFDYGGPTETLTLSNLTVGQQYILAQYNFSYGDNVGSQGGRVQTITDEQNSTGLLYDENSSGGVGGNILLDAFTPTSTNFVVTYKLGPSNAGDSMHQYSLQVTAVPEPSVALLGTAGIGLLASRRRRSN